MDQQILWNDMFINPVETQNLQEFSLSSNETNMPFVNQASEENADLTIWNLGGPSSGGHQANQGSREETKTEHGWASSLTINGGRGSRTEERQLEAVNMLLGSRTEERQLEANNTLPTENMNINLNTSQVDNGQSFPQISIGTNFLQNSDLNAGHFGSSSQVSGREQFMHPHNPGASGSVHVPSSGGSSIQGGSSSRGIISFTGNGEDRTGSSFDGQSLSRKRKNTEGVSAECPASGSSSRSHQSENSLLQPVSSRHNTNTSLSISSSSDYFSGINPPEVQLNPRIGTTARGEASGNHPSLSVPGNAESNQRNCRIRVNPGQNEVPPPNQWAPGSTLRLADPWPDHQPSSMLIPLSQSLETRPIVASGTSQGQPHLLTSSGLVQNMHPFLWNGASNSRTGSSSRSSATVGAVREETNSRPRNNVPELPVFGPITDIRQHLVQDPTSWSLANGSVSVPGSVAPTSRASATSRVHQSLGPTWVPPQNPPSQFHPGVVEVARRSLNRSNGSGPNISVPPQRAVHSSTSPEINHQSAAAVHAHQQSYGRSGLLIDRQNEGVLGVPLPVRSLAAREGRSRMLLEIRNALQNARRGENIRFEDFLLFDHSVFYGRAAELHDRHRDMRLDVDNMSYEELLALEERIGNVSTGLSEETVLKCLKQRKYISLTEEVPKDVEPCCVCQEEYVEGEDVGRLDCGHDFHTACIKQWLLQKNLCPICKTTGLVTKKKEGI